MPTLQIDQSEWNQLVEMVQEMYAMQKARPVTKVWVRMNEFMRLTGKTRDQVSAIVKLHDGLKRKRLGEGVQINYREYNKIYN